MPLKEAKNQESSVTGMMTNADSHALIIKFPSRLLK